MTNNKLSFFRRKSVLIGGFLLLLVISNLFFGNKETIQEVPVEVKDTPNTVTMYPISADNGTAVKTADGSAFIVRAQAGGRVDSVAKIGDVVKAGAVVALLENSAQRAAYIQAEGAYDAAVAASGGNTTSQATAKQDAKRTWNNETVTTEQIVYTSIDTYFTKYSNAITGFKELDSFGTAVTLVQKRNTVETILSKWKIKAAQINEENVLNELNSLSEDLAVIGSLIDDMTSLIPRQTINQSYTKEERDTDSVRLSAARTSITESQRKVDNAITAITNSSGTNAAASNAQIKQALGVLESARAALNKTIIKTPVSGTVSAASISVGDIINVGNDVVFVASDSESVDQLVDSVTVPLTAVKFTPTKAFVFTVVNEQLVAHEVKTGLVTSNNISISGIENINEIVNDVRGLKAGDTVLVK